jgi:cell division septum initiation protein DivIVA
VPFIPPDGIRHRTIDRALRGYDSDQTETLLADITESYRSVWDERDELIVKMAQLEKEIVEQGTLRDKLLRTEAQLAERRETDERLHAALIAAERAMEKLKAEARAEAEDMVARARKRADKIVTKAERRSDGLDEEVQRLEQLAAVAQDECRRVLTNVLRLVERTEPNLNGSAANALPTAD